MAPFIEPVRTSAYRIAFPLNVMGKRHEIGGKHIGKVFRDLLNDSDFEFFLGILAREFSFMDQCVGIFHQILNPVFYLIDLCLDVIWKFVR